MKIINTKNISTGKWVKEMVQNYKEKCRCNEKNKIVPDVYPLRWRYCTLHAITEKNKTAEQQ